MSKMCFDGEKVYKSLNNVLDETPQKFKDDKMIISFEVSENSIDKIYLNKIDNVISLNKKEMVLLRDLFDIALRENEPEDIEELLIPYSDIKGEYYGE